MVAAQVLLAEEGIWLESATDDEMFEFTRQAAAHELVQERDKELSYIISWLEANSRKLVKGEHPVKFTELKQILTRFGYEVDPPNKNILSVTKNGAEVTTIIKQGIQGFRPYHTDYIARLRKQLRLTADEGVDSARFYGRKGVPEIASLFVDLRIEVMQRLAKT